MADNGTIEITGLEDRIRQMGNLATDNPMMHKRINEVIRQALAKVRKELQGEARTGLGMKEDPRKAYKAVRMAVYRKIFGGQVNILQNRKAGTPHYYEPQRHPSRVGGNRRKQSAETRRMMSYEGKDRNMILMWLNGGTTERDTRYGRRGSITARNWFGSSSYQKMQAAAAEIDQMIDDLISGVMF